MARITETACRVAMAFAVAIALLAMLADPTLASPQLCRQLEARLQQVSAGGGRSASSESRRYARAAQTQRVQLDKARRQAQRSGCGGLFGRGGGECTGLNATIRKMERNLASLERRAGAGTGDPGVVRRERARILASLNSNGCRDDSSTRRDERSFARRDGGSLFDRLFGGPVERRDNDERQSRDRQSRSIVRENGIYRVPGPAGQLRTLCVRTCDGYYFPISYASSASDLDRDAGACAAMCPGAEVELYFHRVPSEESEAMVSRAGQPYSELPTAFKYRETGFVRPEGCGCGRQANFEIIAGETAQPVEEAPVEAAVPVPAARPDPAMDPETEANARGGLDVAALRRILRANEPPPPNEENDERRVRVVGPAFLPDPEGAIDLRAPARTEVR